MIKALIFGGNGGIGLATYKLFWQKGHCPIPFCRESLDLGICSYEQMKEILDAIQPDVIVHAAATLKGPNLLGVNLLSAYHIIDYYVRNLTSKPVNITLIGSSSHDKPSPHYPLYAASKAALNSMAASYAILFRETKIYVNLLNPSKTNTKMRREAVGYEPPETLLTPEVVAKEIYQLSTLNFGGVIKNI